MTSFAFILGVVAARACGKGAGAEMRQVLGTAVFSGMIGVTIFGIFLTPVFFSVITRLTGQGKRPSSPPGEPPATPPKPAELAPTPP